MSLLIIKIILIITLLITVIQDIKERKVYWFLFPIIGLSAALLHYFKTLPELFFMSLIINAIFILTILSILFLYTKFKLKIKFSNAFGLGDVFLFLALVCSFSSVSFITLFVFAIICSLALHLILKKNNETTVPLAGYMSLFFAITYLAHWSGFINSVYSL